MRRLALALPALLLSACGGGSAGPLYGGFAPVGGTAIVFPATTCDISFVGTSGVSGVSITLADFPDVCAFRTDTALCGSRADTTFLSAMAVNGVVNGTAAEVGPGTYSFYSRPPTGTFQAATASAVKTDATCTSQAGTKVSMTGGQITITAIEATRVTGTLALSFSDGTSYDQPFDLDRCDPPTDMCIFFDVGRCLAGAGNWTCVQPAP